MPSDLNYPIITKVTRPDAGAWKSDVYICHNEKELVSSWDKILADEIFAQEFVEKKNELDVQGISINQGEEMVCLFAIEYIRLSNKGYGYYMRAVPVTDEKLIEDIHRVVKGMKFEGVFCIEWLIDKEGKRHFLEINLRNDCFGYVSTYGGFNLPFEWAKATCSGHIEYDKKKIKTKPFTAMCSFMDVKQIINYKVSALKWLWQYMTVDCLLDGDQKKPWPLYAMVRALSSGIIKMWFKSTFRLYKDSDYPYAF